MKRNPLRPPVRGRRSRRSRAGRLVAVGLVAVAASVASGGATAGAASRHHVAATAQTPVTSCASLARLDLLPLDTQISAAAERTEGGIRFCEVKGYMSPQTHFTALLPQATWLGDYLQQGCGGFCGHSEVNLLEPSRTSGHQAPFEPLRRGEMVVAADDQGHDGPGALWARDDPQLRVVFGYRSEHDLARTVKALIRAYYGRGPAYSYFDGVSDGGHEAFVLAQRYPADFDGILVGAPAHNWAALAGMYEPWLVRANMDADGRQILDSSKLPALHAAVMAQCADADGVIRDPRACTFDPASIQCPVGADSPSCLTAPQVRTVRDLYRGPHDRAGRNLFDGGEPYGSELSWDQWVTMPANDPNAPLSSIAASLGLDYHRYAAYWRNPLPSFTLEDVRFTVQGYRRLQPLAGIYDATNPDLRAFRASGGKLILYHGWADQAISPWTTLNYYRAVARQLGGFRATQAFSRLYMIPGLYHCPCGPYGNGDPATTVDLMDELVRWVEHGQAPARITLPVSGQTTGKAQTSLSVSPFDPLGRAPRNNGLNSNYRYIGARSGYRPGKELWCHQRGRKLVCSHQRQEGERNAGTARRSRRR